MSRHAPVPALTDRLNAVAGQIAGAVDAPALERAVVAAAHQVADVDRFCLYVHIAEQAGLELIAADGLCEAERSGGAIGVDESRPAMVFRTGRTLLETGDAAALALSEESPAGLRPDVRALMCAPVEVGDRRVGVIGATSTDPYAFDESVVSLLRFVSGLACAAWARLTESGPSAAASVREEYLDEILNTVQAGILIIDAQTFRIQEINQAAARMLGVERDEMVGTRCRDFACPRRACPLRGTDAHNDNVERIFVRKDGVELRVLKSTRPIRIDGREYYLESFVDITDRAGFQESLARSEAKFRALFNSTSDAVMVVDGARFLDCNEAALRIFGCRDYEQFVALGPGDVSPPQQPDGGNSVELARAAMAEALQKGSHAFEWVHRRQDTGEDFPAEVLLSSVKIDGRPLLQGVVRDITERRRYEEQLAASRREYEDLYGSYDQLVGGLREVVFLVDAEGRWTFLNPAWEELTGFSVVDTMGAPFLDYLHEDDKNDNVERFGRLLAGDVDFVRHEARYRRADGGFRWFEVHARLTYDDVGETTGATGTLRDVHEATLVRELLARREAFERAVVGISTDLVSRPLAELDEALEQALGTVGRLLGFERAAISLYSDDGAVATVTHVWVMDGGAPVDPEGRRSSVSGFPRWTAQIRRHESVRVDDVEEMDESWGPERAYLRHVGVRAILAVPIVSGEEAIGYLSLSSTSSARVFSAEDEGMIRVLCDVIANALVRRRHEHELRAAKELAEQAARAKADFLANMSHEIRTPLNGLVGMLNLLDGTELTRDQREFLDMASASSDSLLTVINDILDFSKIEAGRLHIESQPFDLELEVHRLARVFSSATKDKPVDLLVRYDSSAPTGVVGDSVRLRQVLNNLVGNALKFTHHGHVLVDVSAVDVGNDTVTLRFSVEDTGIGIDPDKKRAIFEQFTQADTSTTRKYGGTGLGLAISRNLVALMGGELQVDSRPGAGSTFHFALQFPVAESPTRVAVDGTALSDSRFLVVDDSALNRRILGEYVESWGVPYDACASAEEARVLLQDAHAEGRPYDLAIIDHFLPGERGDELVQRLRRDSRMRDLMVVMVTSLGAHADPDWLECMELEGYLTKPYSRSDLLNAILGAYDERRGGPSRREARAKKQQEAHEAARPVSDFGLRVLLVEDHPINQKAARAMLRGLGCNVEVAENGLLAVDAVQARDFDVVLMDVQMPVMDGYTATRTIRGLNGEHAKLPIVAMTANAMEGDRERCLDAGMTDYLAKPVNKDELIRVLSEVRPPTVVEAEVEEEAPDEVDQPPAFDIASLLEQFDGDQDIVEELVQDFLADTPQLVDAMRVALEQADWDGLGRAAHKLKGSSGYAAAGPIREISFALLGHANRHEGEPAAALVRRLGVELRRYRDAVAAAATG